MLSACLFAVLLEHPGSPVRQAVMAPGLRRIPMGLAMALTAIAIMYSPFGQRSGAHLNPPLIIFEQGRYCLGECCSFPPGDDPGS